MIHQNLSGESHQLERYRIKAVLEISSPQNERYFSPAEREEAVGKIPLGRFGQAEEFASVVMFLCSEQAGYVTGVNLLVDGGASRGL